MEGEKSGLPLREEPERKQESLQTLEREKKSPCKRWREKGRTGRREKGRTVKGKRGRERAKEYFTIGTHAQKARVQRRINFITKRMTERKKGGKREKKITRSG